ncbi:MAG: YafY family protein [Lacrimispora sp.]|uniref:helix-turn-helix transcriptional regulator n=1 Tax=Lacrimispora sp. TaxID=2719234 RepID=UPI0039E55623
MKNDRLFQLLYLLLEQGTMTAPELSSILEVSVRTVYRDAEALSMSGIPVYATRGKGGGISLMPGYTFDKTLLSDEEQNQLLFAIQSLQAADQQVGALLQKLGTAFQKPRQNWIEVDFSRWGLHRTDMAVFNLLKDSILNRQTLNLTYSGTSGETTKRSIHPLKLIYKDKSWYLQAFCLQADDFRLFKISRILHISPAGESFSNIYADDIPPLEINTPSLSSIHLKLRFTEAMAFRVYDEFDHRSITLQPDGHLLVEVDFPMDNWVMEYLFSFGTEIEILEPADLKKHLADYGEKIVIHHRT